MKDLTIYIADDHTFVRKGMMRLLNTFSRVRDVKEAANGPELIELLKHRQPDIVILDLEMPGMSGTEVARHLVENYPNVKIIILTMHTEGYFVLSLIEIGVHGFLSKSAEPEEVEKALCAVADKDFYRNEIVNQALLQNIKRAHVTTKLTAREIEILIHICEELAPSEISSRLHISEKTFFNHRAHILSKIDGRGNVSIVKYAYQHGLLELTDMQRNVG